MGQVANAEKLDEHLKEVVQALHGAVSWGLSHQKDNKLVDKTIHDCEESLDLIMEGKVSEWLN